MRIKSRQYFGVKTDWGTLSVIENNNVFQIEFKLCSSSKILYFRTIFKDISKSLFNTNIFLKLIILIC